MERVVVVGSGLAGLVAAGRLAEAGREVTVLERRSSVGGRVRTREVDGFTLDRGFQVVFDRYPAVRRELDLEALELRRFPAGAVIARPGRRSIVADPRRDPKAVLSTLRNPDVELGDLAKLYRLGRELRGREPGTLFPGPNRTIREELARRGFSASVIDSFLAPFYGGITLDRSLATATAVFEYTFKMLAEGHAAVPARGMGAITTQLAERARAAGATIQTDRTVTGIDVGSDGSGVKVRLGSEPLGAGAVVVATDPRTAKELVDVNTIPTDARGCVTQYYTLSESDALETGGRLLLNAEGQAPNQVVPISSVAPGYAPGNEQLVAAVFLDDVGSTDEELASATRSALESWYPGRSFARLERLATDRIAFAQFDQPPGLHATLPDPADPDGPVFLAGDYTRWSSIQGALESGRAAASAVLHAD